jgi:hypothetical protein
MAGDHHVHEACAIHKVKIGSGKCINGVSAVSVNESNGQYWTVPLL